ENIYAGDSQRWGDESAAHVACEVGQAAEVVRGLDGGLEQRLGRGFPNGTDLSGGQWQKVALARGFFRERADIRVFDEPTAALDASAEAEVFQRIYARRSDSLTIVVAHRLATLRAADLILVLDRGKVVERGSHEELVGRGGRYAELFQLQAEMYSDRGGPT
ncbi:MAG: ABC transporter ATP-binding protein, partial [Myxococcales bacterium]|nr:ABC transporter ATP-binding protein [Myxococcales bacterium]